jgi:hypothetical protein
MNVNVPMTYVAEPPVWTYKDVVRAPPEPIPIEEMEDLGRQGWELAGVFGDRDEAHFYFKRAVR